MNITLTFENYTLCVVAFMYVFTSFVIHCTAFNRGYKKCEDDMAEAAEAEKVSLDEKTN